MLVAPRPRRLGTLLRAPGRPDRARRRRELDPGPVEQMPELRGCDLLFAVDDGGAPALARWLDALEPAHAARAPGRRTAPAKASRGRHAGSRGAPSESFSPGGGARALAHIGALDELLAAGVAIDRVGGCDTGALIAAMLAIGMEPDEIDARCYEEWVGAARSPTTGFRAPRCSGASACGPCSSATCRARSRSCRGSSSASRAIS